MADKPPVRVLFVCTGNSARSQMAEALLRDLGGDRFEAVSAGTHPEADVHPLAVRVMAEIDIDISRQRTKHIDAVIDHGFHYVITVCDRARQECPVLPVVVEQFHWGFDDPAAVEGDTDKQLAAFRRVRQEISTRLRLFVQMPHKRAESPNFRVGLS